MPNKSKDKTIGSILKAKRLELGYSLEFIENELKIKEVFLEYLENDQFNLFDSKVIVKGFLKNYARFLEINHEMLIAIYRRDYENVNMKRKIVLIKDEEEEELEEKKPRFKIPKIVITRRKLLVAGSLILALLFVIVILRTLIATFNKPYLELNSPFEIEGEYSGRLAYDSNEIVLKGKIQRGNSLLINGEVISVNPDLTFETSEIPTTQESNTIVVESENSLGSKTVMNIELYKPERKISVIDSVITSNENAIQLQVKSDGIIRFDGFINNGQVVEISAVKVIEIVTRGPDKLTIVMNGQQYTLTEQTTMFENVDDVLVQK